MFQRTIEEPLPQAASLEQQNRTSRKEPHLHVVADAVPRAVACVQRHTALGGAEEADLRSKGRTRSSQQQVAASSWAGPPGCIHQATLTIHHYEAGLHVFMLIEMVKAWSYPPLAPRTHLLPHPLQLIRLEAAALLL